MNGLCKLFTEYQEKLSDFKNSRDYKALELELLGKTNREKVTRMKNITNLTFSSESVDELDLVHVVGRKELLNRLIAKASSWEDFSCIIEILRSSWIDPLDTRYGFKTEMNKFILKITYFIVLLHSAKKNEWVCLLSAMVKSEEGIVHEEILAVLKQLEDEGKMLDKNVCYL